MNSVLAYIYRRTPAGRQIQTDLFFANKTKIKEFKKEFIPTSVCQKMVEEKLHELRCEMTRLNGIINKLYEESASTDDRNDFIYEIFIEAWKRKLKRVKKSLWRFLNMRYEDNMPLVEKRKEEFDVEEIKRGVPIGQVLETPPLRIDYDREVYSCPLHNEKTPSFTVYKDNNSWYCFGCAKGGDVITLYQAMYGCDFREACRRLTINID